MVPSPHFSSVNFLLQGLFLNSNSAFLCCRILRNNSFSGKIPKEIGDLMELEVLDLGYNNFSGAFPSDYSNNLALTTLYVVHLELFALMSLIL